MLVSDCRENEARKPGQAPRRRVLGGRLLLTLLILGVATWIFYRVQGGSGSVGGTIAPVKAAWLLSVIAYWYVLPFFWVLDTSVSRHARLACWVLLASMTARAVVELWMMYVSENWLHNYGIGHDLFSIGLCLVLTFLVRREESWLVAFFAYCAVLFVFETVFALYLRRAVNADGSVFFLSASDAHTPMLFVTAAIVSVSAIIGALIIWKWTHGTPACRSLDG